MVCAIVNLIDLGQSNYVESTTDGCKLYWAVFGEILLLLQFFYVAYENIKGKC
jgi:hypothetical protein